MFLFVKNFFLFPCYLQGEPLWGNSLQQVLGWDISVSWLLPSWYQSIGYFSVLWYIEKSQTPKACSRDSLPQCKFVIWRSSSIWLQLFKYNSPFVDVGNNNLWPHEKETSTLRGERAVWTIIDHEINLHFFFAES